MRRALFAHWGMGFLLLFAGAVGGCKRSSAAQPPYGQPPPQDGTGSEPIRPEPKITEEEEHARATLLAKLHERLPLLEPDKSEVYLFDAKAKLIETFGPWLPENLRKRIDVGQPVCLPSRTACYVDVSYPDWKTFVEVNRTVINGERVSPLMTFPGPRYRTGRLRTLRSDKKFLATWILALQTRSPKEKHVPNQGREQ